jgi:hypothetical protein
MTTRRSIFKCIPAMIAAAVLPKAWTARASEPIDPIVEEYRKLGYEQTMAAHQRRMALVGETGPEVVTMNTSRMISVTLTDEGREMFERVRNRPKLYIDDKYGGTAELSRAISAEFTIK